MSMGLILLLMVVLRFSEGAAEEVVGEFAEDYDEEGGR
jgi:hypothetical protein